jgi:Skp family chaperone for outer membrane proteins
MKRRSWISTMRGLCLCAAVALAAVMAATPQSAGAPAPPKAPAKKEKGKAQTPQDKAVEKELKKERKGRQPSCYRCDNLDQIEKEIKDNEAARDIYKKQAEHWKKEIDSMKSIRGTYPEARRQSDLETYLNQGRDQRVDDFKQTTNAKGVISLETNPFTCESDVVPNPDPQKEKARKKKVAQFKATTKCCQVFEWSMQHELDHVRACEARNRDGKKLTAEDLANEEANAHQQQVDRLKDLLERAKDNCENKQPSMSRYDENCEGSMRARVEDATERVKRVADVVKQSKKKKK